MVLRRLAGLFQKRSDRRALKVVRRTTSTPSPAITLRISPMRKALLALAAVCTLVLSSSFADAGLFGRHHGADCCDAAPACGCETAVAPSCGCEVAPAYDYGCGCAAPAAGCGHRHHLFGGKFCRKHHGAADVGCCDVAPTCGCEMAVAPSCGYEVAPAYGCGCAAPAAPACGCGHHGKLHGLFHRHHNRGADACCGSLAAPAYAAPACGCGY